MRKMFAFLSIFVLVIGLNACNNDDPVELGRLQFTVTYNGDAVQNAAIAIATNQKNLDAGVYIREVFTDLNGLANFGAMEPGTYYYDGYRYINNNQTFLYASGILTIEPGHKVSKEMELIEKK